MRVKDFEQFDVRRYYRNEIAFVSAFELCGAEFAEFCKDAVPDDRKQFECDKVIAVLFRIVEDAAAHGECDQKVRQDPKRQQGRALPCDARDSGSGRHRYGYRAQVADAAEKDRKQHNGKERSYEDDEARHNRKNGFSARAAVKISVHRFASSA